MLQRCVCPVVLAGNVASAADPVPSEKISYDFSFERQVEQISFTFDRQLLFPRIFSETDKKHKTGA